MNGRKCDVLVEFVSHKDDTGMEKESVGQLTVWAAENNKEIIKSVEGVVSCYNNLKTTRYDVFIDHRYDIEFVAKEIEAAVLCKRSTLTKPPNSCKEN